MVSIGLKEEVNLGDVVEEVGEVDVGVFVGSVVGLIVGFGVVGCVGFGVIVGGVVGVEVGVGEGDVVLIRL
jgi:hypothetical protein